MTIDNCAAIFLGLIVASLVMQFARAKKRERIVRHTDQLALPVQDRAKWAVIEQSFDPFFKGFRKLQIVKNNLSRFTDDFVSEYVRYRYFSRAEIGVTVCMLLFGGFAFYFCG